jgi:hypothetical protein
MASKKEVGSKKVVSVVTALGVAGALGAYFLYGTKAGDKKRKQISGWAMKAKGEVLEKIEKAKDMSEDAYGAVVSGVIAKYKKIKKEHGPEIEALSKELLSYWKQVNKGKSAKKNTKKK